MHTFRYYARIYFLLISQYIKARMIYRADFVISLLGTLVTNILGLAILWLVFQSIRELAGWNYDELLFIYGFALLASFPFQLLFENIWQLSGKLMDGSFIKYYFRPLDIMFYFISERIDMKNIGQLFMAVGVLAYASSRLNISWDVLTSLLFGCLLFGASLALAAIMLLAGALGFWILNSTFMLLFAFRVKEFAHYPINIYNNLFKFIFTYIIPMGFVAFYPAKLILRPDEADILVYFSPLAGVALFWLAYLVWTRGALRYAGTGS